MRSLALAISAEASGLQEDDKAIVLKLGEPPGYGRLTGAHVLCRFTI
jgi:hypothetical protein